MTLSSKPSKSIFEQPRINNVILLLVACQQNVKFYNKLNLALPEEVRAPGEMLKKK